MLYTEEIYNLLSNRHFLTNNSVDNDKRRWYADLEENLEDYMQYFRQIGFRIECGEGYFCFARKESAQTMEDKLKRMYEWINILDFMLTFDASFGDGFTFSKSDIMMRLNDPEMKEKATSMFESKETASEVVNKVMKELQKFDVIEELDSYAEKYKVTACVNYFLTLMNKFEIAKEAEDEIPE